MHSRSVRIARITLLVRRGKGQDMKFLVNFSNKNTFWEPIYESVFPNVSNFFFFSSGQGENMLLSVFCVADLIISTNHGILSDLGPVWTYFLHIWEFLGYRCDIIREYLRILSQLFSIIVMLQAWVDIFGLRFLDKLWFCTQFCVV